jgi:hypothetical protein
MRTQFYNNVVYLELLSSAISRKILFKSANFRNLAIIITKYYSIASIRLTIKASKSYSFAKLSLDLVL